MYKYGASSPRALVPALFQTRGDATSYSVKVRYSCLYSFPLHMNSGTTYPGSAMLSCLNSF
jgi:hypothetical protein